MNETHAREEICRIGKSLFKRGYVHATAGNIRVRLDDGFLITPSDACGGAAPTLRGGLVITGPYAAPLAPMAGQCVDKPGTGACNKRNNKRNKRNTVSAILARRPMTQ